MTWQWIGDQGIQWSPPDLSPDQFLGISRNVLRACEANPIPWVREVVPGFTSVVFLFSLDYRPHAQTMAEIQAWVASVEIIQAVDDVPIKYIPVVYNGPDLAEVAQQTHLSVDEVIRLHGEPIYKVHFLGFLPGFPYLGGMNSRLACPRRSSPRREVPAGSVGIGGEQTGIYPGVSPGGWNIIGHTEVRLFDKVHGAYFSVGDWVKFVAI